MGEPRIEPELAACKTSTDATTLWCYFFSLWKPRLQGRLYAKCALSVYLLVSFASWRPGTVCQLLMSFSARSEGSQLQKMVSLCVSPCRFFFFFFSETVISFFFFWWGWAHPVGLFPALHLNVMADHRFEVATSELSLTLVFSLLPRS